MRRLTWVCLRTTQTSDFGTARDATARRYPAAMRGQRERGCITGSDPVDDDQVKRRLADDPDFLSSLDDLDQGLSQGDTSGSPRRQTPDRQSVLDLFPSRETPQVAAPPPREAPVPAPPPAPLPAPF